MTEAFDAAVAAQDRSLREAGLTIWVGSEPTFTDRRAESPEWLAEALGGDKEARARQLVARLVAHWPGALVLRTLGRQYRGEPRARWSYGLYARRDGAPAWSGPPDPLLPSAAGERLCADDCAAVLATGLASALSALGWSVARIPAAGPDVVRLVFRLDGVRPAADPDAAPELLRPSLHDHPIPETGARDALAAAGDYLVTVALLPVAGQATPVPVVELPAFPDVAHFLAFLGAMQTAAGALASLVLRGFPPPVDASVTFATVTPDPAVIEINMAPAADATSFLRWHRDLYAAAAASSLSPVRYHYNGAETDSGGGGQLTLGGPTPLTSPFLEHPQLLPRLVRYLVRHPSLSYCFATDYLGGASQSPRPDEGTWDRLRELRIALAHLGRTERPSAELLWGTLSHFLCDTSGNLHRSELNIEKLWNPYLPGRGQLGLVEFRAFRMQQTPELATALAMLLRAVCAMLTRADPVPDLRFWGSELHERFALPVFLAQDLREVFTELASHGLGLPAVISRNLDPCVRRQVGEVAYCGLVLRVDAALEFWPLLGDVASQEGGGSRLVDASSRRLQLLLRPQDGADADLSEWQVAVNGIRLPLRHEHDEQGPLRVFGVRYRAFRPWRGLHPGVPAQDPVSFSLAQAGSSEALCLSVHEWAPGGGGYPGLPDDPVEAQRRRAARFVAAPGAAETPLDAPSYALTDYTLDLRCLTD